MINTIHNYLNNYDNTFNRPYVINVTANQCVKQQPNLTIGYQFNRLEKVGNFFLAPLGKSVQWLSNPTTGNLWKVAAVIMGVVGVVFAILGVPLKMIGERLNCRGEAYANVRAKELEVQVRNQQYRKSTAELQSFIHPLTVTGLLDSGDSNGTYADIRMNIENYLNLTYSPTGGWVFDEAKTNDSQKLLDARTHLGRIRDAWKALCEAYAANSGTVDGALHAALTNACGQTGNGPLIRQRFTELIHRANYAQTCKRDKYQFDQTRLISSIATFNSMIFHTLRA